MNNDRTGLKSSEYQFDDVREQKKDELGSRPTRRRRDGEKAKWVMATNLFSQAFPFYFPPSS